MSRPITNCTYSHQTWKNCALLSYKQHRATSHHCPKRPQLCTSSSQCCPFLPSAMCIACARAHAHACTHARAHTHTPSTFFFFLYRDQLLALWMCFDGPSHLLLFHQKCICLKITPWSGCGLVMSAGFGLLGEQGAESVHARFNSLLTLSVTNRNFTTKLIRPYLDRDMNNSLSAWRLIQISNECVTIGAVSAVL